MKKGIFFFFMVAWVLVWVTLAWATYFDTGWVEFRQPNGVTFVGRMWGDEWDYTFQTKDGYPFDKNSADGYYYFALSQRDGVYQLSNLRVGIDAPRNIPTNLSAHIPRPVRLGKNSLSPSGPNQPAQITWTLKVIMVEFQDVHGNNTWTRANFSNMLFSSNYYKTESPDSVHSPSGEDVYGSLRDYYDAMSNGHLIITGQILNGPLPGGDRPNWIRLSQNKNYYYSHSYWDLHDEAIDSANARGYDTSTGSTTRLVILYAGNFYLSNLTPRNLGDSYIMYERWWGRGGLYGPDYDTTAPFGHIGVHAHEFGHFLWYVDLYNSPYNIIDWCLMGDACDLGGTLSGDDIQNGSCPGPINAEFRRQQGWITVQDLTSDVLPATFTYNERTPTVYRRQIGTNEYFLAESKRFQGYSRFLAGHKLGHDGGLLIWQVQGTLSVYLERADNVADGDYYNGEPNDIFPGPTVNNTSFHPLSTPNSSKLDGTRSGFGLTNISVITGTGVSANAYINYLVSNSTDATAFNSSRKLARDSAGKYHLVYESGGEIYCQYSTTGNNTWLGLTRLSAGNGNNKYPCLAERSGNLYVVWQRYDGSSHDIYFRTSSNGGSTWATATELASNVGTNAPLPAIVASVPSHSLDLMVVYRGSDGLKYRRYTGGSWQAVATVNGTTSASRNPSLVYKSNDYGYYNLTWDDDNNVYHQIFYGSSWGTPAYRVNNPDLAAYNRYSSYALSGNLDRHIVWHAFDFDVYQKYVIYHNKNLNSTIFTMFATYECDYLRPTGSGHSGGALTVVWHDASISKNIRKVYYNGYYWESNPSIIASNGTDASLSVVNPPGATAKAVWRSAGTSPYTLSVGPSGGLGKSVVGEIVVYNRRAVYALDNTAVLALQMRTPQIISRGSNSALPFPEVADDDSLVAAQLAGKMSLSNILLPADADSLVFTVHTYSREAGELRQNSQLPLQVSFVLSPATVAAKPVTVSLAPVVTKGEGRQAMRLAFPVQTFRGQMVNLQTVLNNLDVAKSQGVLIHVYEVIESDVSKSGEQPASTTLANEHELRLHIYPNPFNPSTQIRFTIKAAGMAALRIYNLQGQLVRELLHEHRIAGEHMVQWDGRDNRGAAAASGVYFIRFDSDNKVKVNKVMLVR